MIKSFFSKIFNFIQWTKKWHICHMFFSGTVTTLIFIIIANLAPIDETPEITDGININTIFSEFGTIDYVFIAIFGIYALSVFILFISFFISIVIFIIKYLKKEHYCVTNKFLLSNRLYNIYYSFSLLLILFSACFTIITFLSTAHS